MQKIDESTRQMLEDEAQRKQEEVSGHVDTYGSDVLNTVAEIGLRALDLSGSFLSGACDIGCAAAEGACEVTGAVVSGVVEIVSALG
jgi:hypothetical protein